MFVRFVVYHKDTKKLILIKLDHKSESVNALRKRYFNHLDVSYIANLTNEIKVENRALFRSCNAIENERQLEIYMVT